MLEGQHPMEGSRYHIYSSSIKIVKLKEQILVLSTVGIQKLDQEIQNRDKIVIQLLNGKSAFVNLKSNSALLYIKGHNFWKSVLTWKIPQNWKFPY